MSRAEGFPLTRPAAATQSGFPIRDSRFPKRNDPGIGNLESGIRNPRGADAEASGRRTTQTRPSAATQEASTIPNSGFRIPDEGGLANSGIRESGIRNRSPARLAACGRDRRRKTSNPPSTPAQGPRPGAGRRAVGPRGREESCHWLSGDASSRVAPPPGSRVSRRQSQQEGSMRVSRSAILGAVLLVTTGLSAPVRGQQTTPAKWLLPAPIRPGAGGSQAELPQKETLGGLFERAADGKIPPSELGRDMAEVLTPSQRKRFDEIRGQVQVIRGSLPTEYLGMLRLAPEQEKKLLRGPGGQLPRRFPTLQRRLAAERHSKEGLMKLKKQAFEQARENVLKALNDEQRTALTRSGPGPRVRCRHRRWPRTSESGRC